MHPHGGDKNPSSLEKTQMSCLCVCQDPNNQIMDMTAILISIDALISSVFAHTSMKPIAFTVLFLAVFAVDYCKSIPTMHNKADQFAERLLGKFGSSFIRIQKNDCCRINQALNCCTLRWYWNEIQL